jgi:hypothetical protein
VRRLETVIAHIMGLHPRHGGTLMLKRDARPDF